MRVAYTLEEKRKAVQTYKKLGSYTKAIRQLGVPSRILRTFPTAS